GHFGRKEKNGWRSQGRNGTENINHRGGYHGGGTRTRTSNFHCGKSQGLHENNIPENEAGKKEDKEEPKQFEAEDFPSLNPEYERETNQNKSLASGVWEYPLNPKSRSPRMLVIKKGSTKELQISRFPLIGGLHSQSVKNGTSTSVYKGLVPKPVTPSAKMTQWKSQTKENKLGNPFPHESTYSIGNFSAFKSTAKAFNVSQNSAKEVKQVIFIKSVHFYFDFPGKCLRALAVLLTCSQVGQESSLCLVITIHRDSNLNHLKQSPFFPCLSSLEYVKTDSCPILLHFAWLLKEMGWQEDSENDETCAPLTEDEMREFKVISEQLQKNGLRKNGILKNGLICDFKFSPWKNGTFKPALEIEDSETSSSDTSDDDDV
ncbi:GPBP1 protein, partial [Crypturellus soui]|nr:GPBP1 protein [Crypturellus soui]